MITASVLVRKLAVLQPIIILFLVLTTVGFGALSIIRGQVILDLQSKLIEKQDKRIEVIVENVKAANAITDSYVKEKHTHEIRYQQVKGEAETIIKENTVFLNTCISDDGVQHYNQYVSTSIGAESEAAVSTTGSIN